MAPKEFSNNLEKIVLDFRYNYKHLKGDSIGPALYKATLVLPGSVQSTILYPTVGKDTTATYRALLFENSDYSEAAKAYSKLCKNVRNASIRWFDRSDASFAGEIIHPEQGKSSAVSVFRLGAHDKRYYRYQAEVSLVRENNGYKVYLQLKNRA